MLNGCIADDGDRGIEAALPAGLGRVADQKTFGCKPSSYEHRLRDALEVIPARSDADQIAGVRGHVALEVGLQLRRDRMNLEGD